MKNKEKDSLIQAVKKHALEYGDFTLPNGDETNFYFDCKKLTLSAEGVFEIVKAMWCVLYMTDVGRTFRTEFDAIGGPSLGSAPIVGAFCYNQGRVGKDLRAFLIRKGEDKPLGTVQPKDKVILVDDVAASGETLADAFDKISDFGAEVIKAITIIDRQEGAEKLLAQRGVPWQPLLKLEDLEVNGNRDKN